MAWAILHPLGEALSGRSGAAGERGARSPQREASWMDRWLLRRGMVDAFVGLGREDWLATLDMELVDIAIRYLPLPAAAGGDEQRSELLRAMLDDPTVRDYLFINQFDGILWLNKEQLESMMYWLLFLDAVRLTADSALNTSVLAAAIQGSFELTQGILRAAETARYQVQELVR